MNKQLIDYLNNLDKNDNLYKTIAKNDIRYNEIDVKTENGTGFTVLAESNNGRINRLILPNILNSGEVYYIDFSSCKYIKVIGPNCFKGMTNIKEINFGGVEKIEEGALNDLQNLKKINVRKKNDFNRVLTNEHKVKISYNPIKDNKQIFEK